MASGKVTLPAGSKLSLVGLTVNTAIDSQPVSATGSFKVATLGAGVCRATLRDADGNLILFGHLDASSTGSAYAGGKGQISATETAVDLLFYQLQGYVGPAQFYQQVLASIASSSQVASAASTISTRVAANPLALSQGDPQIISAVKSAATAIMTPILAKVNAASSLRPAAQAVPAKTSQTMQIALVKNAASSGNQVYDILTTPGQQSGVSVLASNSSPTGVQVSFQNQFRRRCAVFIYETAIVPTGSTTVTPITPVPLKIAAAGLDEAALKAMTLPDPLSNPYDIQPTQPINGIVGTAVDILFGNFAWVPTTTGPVTLPADPNADKTIYTIVMVGPAQIDNEFYDPAYKSLWVYVPDWQNELAALSLETDVLDVMMPLFFSIPWPEGLEEAAGLFGNAVVGDFMNAAAAVPDAITAAKAGNVSSLWDTILQNGFDSASWRDPLAKKIVVDVYKGVNTLSPAAELAAVAKVGTMMKEFSKLFAIADFVLLAIDEGAIFYAENYSDQIDYWQGTEYPTKGCGAAPAPFTSTYFSIALDPSGTYAGNQTGTMTITVPAGHPDLTQLVIGLVGRQNGFGSSITDVTYDGVNIPNNSVGDFKENLTKPGSYEVHKVHFYVGYPTYQCNLISPTEMSCNTYLLCASATTTVTAPSVYVAGIPDGYTYDQMAETWFNLVPTVGTVTLPYNPADLAARVQAEMAKSPAKGGSGKAN